MSETNTSLRVFISYARKDAADFADELLTALEVAGFDPFLDRHDISPGEDWENRLSALIQAADTIVFVITPTSAASERCRWEVDKAIALSKRIIPVVLDRIADADVPEPLKRLNYIYFTPDLSFARALAKLAGALKTDIAWVREHTRLGDLAARWDGRKRDEESLLRGLELETARNWIAAWKAGAPDITALHRAYIGASDEAEQSRISDERKRLEVIAEAQGAREQALQKLSRRTTIGIGIAGALTAAAGGLTYWGVSAESRFQREREERERAEAQSVERVIAAEAVRADLKGQLKAIGAVRRQGSEAADEQSPYSRALLRRAADPNIALLDAILRAGDDVRGQADHTPSVATDLNGDIYLKRPSPARRKTALILPQSEIAGRAFTAPKRDADAWDVFLRACGFSIVRLDDATKNDVISAIDNLPVGATDNALLLLYFAGGGVSMDGEDYILCSDSQFDNDEHVLRTTIALDYIEERLRSALPASALVFDTSFVDYRLARFL